jgi:DNA-binding CsgD family transcriptional regulator
VPDESNALELAKAVADEVRDGIVLCDAKGKSLHMNERAASLLAVSHAAEVEQIAMSAMAVGTRHQAQVNGFMVTAAPIRRGSVLPIGIITIRLNRGLPDADSLRARFGLSRREAEVAVLLADRRTDAEIAAALGISWHTVRSHVERVFASLQCHTRRDAAEKLKSP